jgi:hypothetical protein
MPPNVTIIIIEKTGTIKQLIVKEYKEDELFKKCGFKKADGFQLQVEWPVKIEGQKYVVAMFGKIDGKANMENKYDFPPPIDKNLYFGSCALVGMIRDDSNTKSLINLTEEVWNKIYEKLFGGFEDLALCCVEDEEEEDELEKIPKNMKTKNGGYLKDGFVVDSSDAEEELSDSSEEEDELEKSEDVTEEEEEIIEDVGSEISEEQYE